MLCCKYWPSSPIRQFSNNLTPHTFLLPSVFTGAGNFSNTVPWLFAARTGYVVLCTEQNVHLYTSTHSLYRSKAGGWDWSGKKCGYADLAWRLDVVKWLIGCLHDPANVQQTYSEYTCQCWTFAGSCKHPINHFTTSSRHARSA